MATLLPVTGNDEQRVVDADRQPDHRDHVGDEEAEVEELADQCGQPHGDGDGDDSEDDRDHTGDHRAKDPYQDHEGDPDSDGLPQSEVLFGNSIEVVHQCRRAGHEGSDPIRGLHAGDGLVKQIGVVADQIGVVTGDHNGEERGASGLGNWPGFLEIGADADHHLGTEAADGRLKLGDVSDVLGVAHVGGVRSDHHEFGVGGLPSQFGDEVGRYQRLGLVGEGDRCGQGTGEQLRRHDCGGHQEDHPDEHRPPRSSGTRPGQSFGPQ